MRVQLAGQCQVVSLDDHPAAESALFGVAFGSQAISMRQLRVEAGNACRGRSPGVDVWFVLEGEGVVRELPGPTHALRPDLGVFVPAGRDVEIQAIRSLHLVSVRCPDPQLGTTLPRPDGERLVTVALADQEKLPTGDRWYRLLVDPSVGSHHVTQFVGSIPPGRAPDHYHEYEEVLCVLSGRGRMWAENSHTPIGPGSCVFLPRRQVHCLENTSPGELRVMGVFYPAGSPAQRYDVSSDTA